MTKVTFHHFDGNADVIDAEAGISVMRSALSNGVEGIVGECGGQAMCATCHVYVRPGYFDSLPAISEDEEEMLDCTAEPRDPSRSRLGCQIITGPHLEAIEVDLPESQV